MVLPTDSWHHVAATVDAANSMKLYIDGTEVASGSHSISNWTPIHGDNDTALSIGTVYHYGDGWGGGGLCVNGKIDEVMIYGRALSAEEIETIGM